MFSIIILISWSVNFWRVMKGKTLSLESDIVEYTLSIVVKCSKVSEDETDSIYERIRWWFRARSGSYVTILKFCCFTELQFNWNHSVWYIYVHDLCLGGACG